MESSSKIVHVSSIGKDGSLAPIVQLPSPREHAFPERRGARRWSFEYKNGCTLHALGINLESDTLVVSFHGALNRSLYHLPRFERFASLCQLKVSSLLFSDPTLELDSSLQLGWYVGWKGSGLFDSLAAQISSAHREHGFRKLIISGSSGGGYAALQVSARIPGSVALVFNPQTHIHGYHDDGLPETHAAERKFIEVAYPEAAADGIWNIDFDHDWTHELGSEYSALRRYEQPVTNSVVYANNINDWHVSQHYEPFVDALKRGDNIGRLSEYRYESVAGHRPPNLEEFQEGIAHAMKLASEADASLYYCDEALTSGTEGATGMTDDKGTKH